MSLVTASRFLARSQLLQVKVTHQHVAVVLLQTSGEGSGVRVTASGLFLERLLLLRRHLLLWGLGRRRGAAKHAGDTCTKGVADSGSHGNTSGSGGHLAKQTWSLLGLGWGGVRHGGWVRVRRSRRGGCVGRSGLGSHGSGSSLSRHYVFFVCGEEEERRREFLCAKLVATEWPGKCRVAGKNQEKCRTPVPSVPSLLRMTGT